MKNSTPATSHRRAVVVAALACAIALPAALSGCDDRPASDQGASGDTSSPAATAAENDQAAEAPTFSPSQGLDEDGHWEGVTALDYVALPAYEGIEVPKADITPSDEAVQAQVDSILANYTTTEHVTDRAIADGDTVNIDYVGSIDGVEFEGGSTKEQGTTVTIGVTQYIDDFLEQLIGHTPGETFDIEVTFPEDYGNEELNGKDAVFNITVNFIQEQVAPELTDEWVTENLSESRGWKTVDEMRSSIASDLERSMLSSYLQNKVVEESTVSEIPEELITYQEDSAIAEVQNYASMYGFKLEDMLSMLTGYATTDEYLAANEEAIKNAAKSHLVFQAIAEDADVNVTDEDVQAYFKNNMGMDNIDSLEQSYGMPYLKLVTLIDKVNDLLQDTAVIEE